MAKYCNARLTNSELKTIERSCFYVTIPDGAIAIPGRGSYYDLLESRVAAAQLEKALWWVVEFVRQQADEVEHPLSVEGATRIRAIKLVITQLIDTLSGLDIEPWPRQEEVVKYEEGADGSD